MTQASWPSSSVVNTPGHWSSWCCTIVSWGGVWCAVLTVELSLMPPKLPHSDFYTHKRNASFPSTDRWHLNRCLNLTRARSLPVPVFLLLRDGVTEQQSTLALDCGLSIRLNSSILMWRSLVSAPGPRCIVYQGQALQCWPQPGPGSRIAHLSVLCGLAWPCTVSISWHVSWYWTRVTWHRGAWPDLAQTQIQECRGECGQRLNRRNILTISCHSSDCFQSDHSQTQERQPQLAMPPQSPVARWRSLTKFESDNQFSCQIPPSTGGDMRAWEHTGTCPD